MCQVHMQIVDIDLNQMDNPKYCNKNKSLTVVDIDEKISSFPRFQNFFQNFL